MKINFISVRPQGFWVEDAVYTSLRLRIIKEGYARKLWKIVDGKRELVCFSSNANLSQTGTRCTTCFNIKQCHLKLRLYFKLNDRDSCLELPLTSFKNYQLYKKKLSILGRDVKNITTLAFVKNRGYWGEVNFSLSNRDSN